MNIFQRNAKKLAIVATIAGASSVIFIRLIDMEPIAMGFYRLLFAIVFFAVPIIMGGYKDFKGLTLKDYLYCAVAGLFMACHFFAWFTAVKNTTIANASVLASFHPIAILIIMAIFMRQRTNIKAIAGIFVALTGGAIIAGIDHTAVGSHMMGNMMALISAFCFGCYFLVGRTMRAKLPAVNYVFLVFASCLVFLMAAMFVTGTPFTGYGAQDYIWSFVMAIACQIIAHALFNWCIGYTSSLYVSVCVSIDPVFSIIFGAICFREFPTAWQYVGIVVAVSGLLYFNYNDGKSKQ